MNTDQNNPFDRALSNFTFSMANGDLICHMAAEGYSVKQIKEATDYPVSAEKIRESVWEYYLESGIVRLKPPGDGDDRHYEYVMDIGRFGKRSFRRTEAETKTEQGDRSYIPCRFGITRAHDPDLYKKQMDSLDSRKRDYVEGLPWPDQTVWHIDNLMIREIRDILSEKGLW